MKVHLRESRLFTMQESLEVISAELKATYDSWIRAGIRRKHFFQCPQSSYSLCPQTIVHRDKVNGGWRKRELVEISLRTIHWRLRSKKVEHKKECRALSRFCSEGSKHPLTWSEKPDYTFFFLLSNDVRKIKRYMFASSYTPGILTSAKHPGLKTFHRS